MKQRWTEPELVAHWTLTESEKQLLEQRTARGRLGLAVMLKFFQLEGRFPRYHKEVPLLALDFVAEQLAIPVAAWFAYPLTGRSGKRDREHLRDFLGFRPATTDDGQRIQDWLTETIVPKDQAPAHLRAAVLEWCWEHRIEPPTTDRIERIVGAAVRRFENTFFATIDHQLSPSNRQRLDALLATTALDEPDVDLDLNGVLSPFSHLKADSGRVGLASVLKEIAKLKRIDDVQLPVDLFTGVAPKTLERYRLRVATESVQELRRHPEPIRYPLLAAAQSHYRWLDRAADADCPPHFGAGRTQSGHRNHRRPGKGARQNDGALPACRGGPQAARGYHRGRALSPRGRGDASSPGQGISCQWPDLSASCPHPVTQQLPPSLPAHAAADPGCTDISFQQCRPSASHPSPGLAQGASPRPPTIYRL